MSTELPLVVDLDGTLILSDSLLEGFVQLWRQQPINVAFVPSWMLRGKVALKREIANRVVLDAPLLPYNEKLIAYLREQRAHRKIVLCSAADQRFADAVAKHLDLFDEVIATSGSINLRSANKAKELVSRFGAQGFDYIGNDVDDIAVFKKARFAVAVNPTRGLRRRLSSVSNLQPFSDDASNSAWIAHLRALRPTQWVKNLLVFVPLLAVFKMSEVSAIIPATIAFISFCLVASS
ncbi:MAG: haloacid dehalogenase-like hydrolase, partial [Gemmatimonadaceae bacterium]